MPTSLPDVFGAIRRPEYTGENRCVPCTAVNAVIAALGAIGIGLIAAVTIGPDAGIALGTATSSIFAATIYVRGYLVPGTPQFTRAYFPEWLLRRFHNQSTKRAATSPGTEFLTSVGVVTEDECGEDLRPTDDFREDWRARINSLREREDLRDEAATVLNVNPSTLRLDDYGTAFVAFEGDTEVGRWESRAAFLADVAAAKELGNRYEGWDDLDVSERYATLGELRIFIDRCPSCDGAVAMTEDPIEGCCGSGPLYHVVRATCQSCGTLLMEVENHG